MAATPAPIDPLVRQLNMRGRGQGDLIAFLRALDDPDFDRTIPDRVPSGLPVGGLLQPSRKVAAFVISLRPLQVGVDDARNERVRAAMARANGGSSRRMPR